MAFTNRTSASSRRSAAADDGAVDSPAGEVVVMGSFSVERCWHPYSAVESASNASAGICVFMRSTFLLDRTPTVGLTASIHLHCKKASEHDSDETEWLGSGCISGRWHGM